MLNFLPQKNKKGIVFEYEFRVITVFLSLIFIVALFAISFFSPSYFYVKYRNITVKNQLSAIEKSDAGSQDPTLIIKNANRLANALSSDISSGRASYGDLLNKIISYKNKDIKINSINISDNKTSKNRKILITGMANTRDALTNFSTDIKTDGFFSTVTFPVSDFLKSTDLEFSATLIYNTN